MSAFHAPYMDDDLSVLEANFRTTRCIGHGPGRLVRILAGALRSDLVFCWFASVYAAIGVWAAVVTGKKSVVVLGGVDVAKEPSLGYGLWLSPWKARLARYAIRHADLVIAGDPGLRADAVRLAEYDGKNIVHLSPGFDSEAWKPLGEKERMVLTVAFASNEARARVKGIDTLVAAATILTNTRFVLIGVEPHVKAGLAVPGNMEVVDLVPRKDLLDYYRRAKVYCQPSRREAVGYAIREAMLCGCVPVASDVGGLTAAAAGIGELVPPGDVEALVVALQKSLRAQGDEGARARAHIVALNPLVVRKQALARLLDGLLS